MRQLVLTLDEGQGTIQITYAFINAGSIVWINSVQLSEIVLLHDRVRILTSGIE